MDNEIKIGKIVKLKSGGPKMTVTEKLDIVKGMQAFRCMWFIDVNESRTDEFPAEALKLIV